MSCQFNSDANGRITKKHWANANSNMCLLCCNGIFLFKMLKIENYYVETMQKQYQKTLREQVLLFSNYKKESMADEGKRQYCLLICISLQICQNSSFQHPCICFAIYVIYFPTFLEYSLEFSNGAHKSNYKEIFLFANIIM